MLAKEFSMHGRPPPLKEIDAREFQSKTDNLTIGNSGNLNIPTYSNSMHIFAFSCCSRFAFHY